MGAPVDPPPFLPAEVWIPAEQLQRFSSGSQSKKKGGPAFRSFSEVLPAQLCGRAVLLKRLAPGASSPVAASRLAGHAARCQAVKST